MGRRKGKSGNKPWHSAYNHLNLAQIFSGKIPKLIRTIQAAKARLLRVNSANAANIERRLIEKSLAAVEEIYDVIRTALLHRGHMNRWKEFPGLESAVSQVSDIDWSDLQGKEIPGGPFKFNVPKLDDKPSPGNTNPIKSDHDATNLAVKGDPVQKPIKDEVNAKVKEVIKDEDKVMIKLEPDDEPGVPIDFGPLERFPSPAPATLGHEPHVPPYVCGSLYQAGFFSESPFHWMPQPSFHQPGYPPTYWHGLPNPYCPPQFPTFYPFIPYYNFDFASIGSNGKIGRFNTQVPNHSQRHAIPERLGVPVPAPPGISPSAFLPPPLFPPPSLPPPSSTLPSKPSTALSIPTAPPPRHVVSKQADDRLDGKRKLSNSLVSSSDSSRPLKRRVLDQGGNISGASETQLNRSKLPRPESGLPDFGTWFQGQIADSKKKLSHLERGGTPSDNRNGV